SSAWSNCAISVCAAFMRASSGLLMMRGTAIAASTPRITITTMISISVKPRARFLPAAHGRCILSPGKSLSERAMIAAAHTAPHRVFDAIQIADRLAPMGAAAGDGAALRGAVRDRDLLGAPV